LNIIITGGTSGLGYRTAFILAKDNKNKIILIGKNKDKGNQAIKSLTNETNNKNISFLQADLSSISETSSLKEKLANKKIDVLINNAERYFIQG
jgi:short-subunit dehydrogenase